MGERIDNLVYQPATQATRVEGEQTSLYLTGPAEFLVKQVAAQLLADPAWSALFGENIDPYKRMDYSMRALPALRVYHNGYRKTAESWFIEGQLVLDMIFPASVRREETMQYPDTVCAAMLQQFRRPSFFASMCAVVPGLNQLGKTFDVDNALAFEWEDELVPLTQMLVNFRMDLREWDEYLESDYRTKDTPFEQSLADLAIIATTIRGLNDDGTTNVEIESDAVFTLPLDIIYGGSASVAFTDLVAAGGADITGQDIIQGGSAASQ